MNAKTLIRSIENNPRDWVPTSANCQIESVFTCMRGEQRIFGFLHSKTDVWLIYDESTGGQNLSIQAPYEKSYNWFEKRKIKKAIENLIDKQSKRYPGDPNFAV